MFVECNADIYLFILLSCMTCIHVIYYYSMYVNPRVNKETKTKSVTDRKHTAITSKID